MSSESESLTAQSAALRQAAADSEPESWASLRLVVHTGGLRHSSAGTACATGRAELEVFVTIIVGTWQLAVFARAARLSRKRKFKNWSNFKGI